MFSYHRVVPPCEEGERVLVLTELLPDFRPHALELPFQHDDDGLPAQLQQVQQAPSDKNPRANTLMMSCTIQDKVCSCQNV